MTQAPLAIALPAQTKTYPVLGGGDCITSRDTERVLMTLVALCMFYQAG